MASQEELPMSQKDQLIDQCKRSLEVLSDQDRLTLPEYVEACEDLRDHLQTMLDAGRNDLERQDREAEEEMEREAAEDDQGAGSDPVDEGTQTKGD
jgi:hypothetical protein